MLARPKRFELLTPRFVVLVRPLCGPLTDMAFFRVRTKNPIKTGTFLDNAGHGLPYAGQRWSSMVRTQCGHERNGNDRETTHEADETRQQRTGKDGHEAGDMCRKHGMRPVVFAKMRAQHGTIEAIERLVTAPVIDDFLKEMKQLGIDTNKWSLEAIAIKFKNEFDPATVQCARWRLKLLEEDVS